MLTVKQSGEQVELKTDKGRKEIIFSHERVETKSKLHMRMRSKSSNVLPKSKLVGRKEDKSKETPRRKSGGSGTKKRGSLIFKNRVEKVS